jgi:DNA polymerase IV
MKIQTNFTDLQLNSAEPRIMHIDLNSCFATIEQQANRLLRGRPIATAAYLSPRGCITAPSIEAKQFGVKTGMMVMEGKELCPELLIVPQDPPKYRDVHLRFKRIFMSYTNVVKPKSIDEVVIDFTGSQVIKHKSMEQVGYEIKKRVKEELGEWMRVNVGIAPNRFLAKTAAGLHKPDGLDTITCSNVLDVYQSLSLTDLDGIAERNQARLNSAGILTPLQFLETNVDKLKREVFHSINGYYWYLRLRGYEIDAEDTKRKSIGHTYALGRQTNNIDELSRLMMKLCEKVGRRMRRYDYTADGIHVACYYADGGYWHKGTKIGVRLYTTQEIYYYAMQLLRDNGPHRVVRNLFITVYSLNPFYPEQLSLFDGSKQDKRALSKALDTINDRYGEMTIVPALMMGMGDIILDRVAFGSVKDMTNLYEDEDEY